MLTNKKYYPKNKRCQFNLKKKILTNFAFLIPLAAIGRAMAEEPSAPYLQYQEPQQAATSLFSTGSYIFSLLATFLLVLVLAYFTSKLVANKMNWTSANKDSKIISTLSFGSGKAVYLVEIAGKYLILGVTEHNINLLREISEQEEVEKIKRMSTNSLPSLPNEPFDFIFRRQISSLQQMSQKFPAIFGTPDSNYNTSQERRTKTQNSLNRYEEDNREKR